MMLSPNFSLSEFTKSPTAIRLGIDNTPDEVAIAALKRLCTEVLEPVRAHFGKPIMVTSGYRCPALNKAVGSAPTSQHIKGEAADIEIAGVANGDIAKWIRFNLDFDQVILEFYTPGDPSSGWVHVSYRAADRRKEAITALKQPGGGTYYRAGLAA